MAKILVLLLTLLSLPALSQQDYTSGEGHFGAQASDKPEFVKAQLLYEATKDVITKEMAAMGFNHELFWEKYNERLNASLKILEESLKNEKKESEYRTRSLLKRKNFGHLESVIQSYSISGQSRAGGDPNSRYIKIDARVNKQKLSELYHQFTRTAGTSSGFDKLYVQIKVNLNGLSLSDIGIDNEKDLYKELGVNWLDLLKKQRPNNISNVELLTENLEERLRGVEEMEHEELFSNLPGAFTQSLLLTVTVDVTKQLIDQDHRKAQVKYAGGVFLKDLSTSEIHWEGTLSGGSQKFDFRSNKDIGQKVINYVYRMPLVEFKTMSSVAQKLAPVKLVKRVNLFNYQNITELNNMVQFLQQMGLQYSLKARILTLSPTSSEVVIHSESTEADLKALLKANESAKRDLKYELIDSDGVIGIKFMHGATTQST